MHLLNILVVFLMNIILYLLNIIIYYIDNIKIIFLCDFFPIQQT